MTTHRVSGPAGKVSRLHFTGVETEAQGWNSSAVRPGPAEGPSTVQDTSPKSSLSLLLLSADADPGVYLKQRAQRPSLP